MSIAVDKERERLRDAVIEAAREVNRRRVNNGCRGISADQWNELFDALSALDSYEKGRRVG